MFWVKLRTRVKILEARLRKARVEEDKARRKIELKCASVDDLISKLKAFKGALHNNKKLNTDADLCNPRTLQEQGTKFYLSLNDDEKAVKRLEMFYP
ncbi:hypothetical protein PIB30_075478 [Stylosanthes scabra]|uniref:Uncharacterized protein n=1 Tax=Stylosanthes scabra TaxID=79078 RepID=A0ABU6QPL8_9FABA|nr:hypothetical protein [Stylosanthes scabra]